MTRKLIEPINDRDRFWHAAETMQHDLKDFLAQTDAGETDRQRGDRALDRHDGEKIDHRDVGAKRVGDAKKSRKGREMRDERSAERGQGGTPMLGVEMISGGDLNQFFAAGKSFRQFVSKIESADDK